MNYNIILVDGRSPISCHSYEVHPEGIYYWIKNKIGKKRNGETFIRDVPTGFIPTSGYLGVEIKS